MTTLDPVQAIALPDYADPPNVPDHLSAILAASLSRGIPRFSTTAQRDAAYPAPTNGQFAWIETESALYARRGGAWVNLNLSPWESLDSGTVTWDAAVGATRTVQADRQNGRVDAYFTFQVGTIATGGNVLTLPVGWRPARQQTMVLAPNAANPTNVLMAIATTGLCTVNWYGTAPTTTTYFRGTTSWKLA